MAGVGGGELLVILTLVLLVVLVALALGFGIGLGLREGRRQQRLDGDDELG